MLLVRRGFVIVDGVGNLGGDCYLLGGIVWIIGNG